MCQPELQHENNDNAPINLDSIAPPSKQATAFMLTQDYGDIDEDEFVPQRTKTQAFKNDISSKNTSSSSARPNYAKSIGLNVTKLKQKNHEFAVELESEFKQKVSISHTVDDKSLDDYESDGMLVIGMLGGISYQASSDYYIKINEKVQKQLKYVHTGHSSKIIMNSMDIEEYETCCYSGNFHKVATLIANECINLKKGGADFLIMACNTAHLAIPKIIELDPTFPILHIADTTANYLKINKYKTVGLLGSKWTMTRDHISSQLNKHNIKVVTPTDIQIIDELERIIIKELPL